eukprot:scaffold3418_cov124-Isochrysis_galbana.AAC.37
MGAAFKGNSRHGQTTETEHRVNSPGESGSPPCAFCRERNPGSGRGEAGGAPPTNASHLVWRKVVRQEAAMSCFFGVLFWSHGEGDDGPSRTCALKKSPLSTLVALAAARWCIASANRARRTRRPSSGTCVSATRVPKIGPARSDAWKDCTVRSEVSSAAACADRSPAAPSSPARPRTHWCVEEIAASARRRRPRVRRSSGDEPPAGLPSTPPSAPPSTPPFAQPPTQPPTQPPAPWPTPSSPTSDGVILSPTGSTIWNWLVAAAEADTESSLADACAAPAAAALLRVLQSRKSRCEARCEAGPEASGCEDAGCGDTGCGGPGREDPGGDVVARAAISLRSRLNSPRASPTHFHRSRPSGACIAGISSPAREMTAQISPAKTWPGTPTASATCARTTSSHEVADRSERRSWSAASSAWYRAITFSPSGGASTDFSEPSPAVEPGAVVVSSSASRSASGSVCGSPSGERHGLPSERRHTPRASSQVARSSRTSKARWPGSGSRMARPMHLGGTCPASSPRSAA